MLLPHPILIRQANHADMDWLIEFSAAMAWETEGRKLDTARLRQGTMAVLSNPHRGFFMVAEVDDGRHRRVVGQLMVTFEWSDWRNGVFWWVQSIYVDPDWRRRGVYRSLHDHVVAQAKADPQVCGIRLYVEKDNHSAQSVYQRVGLIPSGYAVYEQDFVLPSRSSTMSEKSR